MAPVNEPPSPTSPTTATRSGRSNTISSVTSRLRSASVKLMDADPPPGMWAATANATATAPTLTDIRKGTFGEEGWHAENQRRSSVASEKRRRSSAASARERRGEPSPTHLFPAVTEETNRPSFDIGRIEASCATAPRRTQEKSIEEIGPEDDITTSIPSNDEKHPVSTHRRAEPPPYTYEPPPKLPWTTSTKIALKAFWKWFLTPIGFLVTIYGLNVVAWGGMLFLLLCNAAPAMCHPTCNDINSPRRKWLEVDSQILNALFCVTGFGTIPWRFRDLYYLLVWRMPFFSHERRSKAIRRLAGVHNNWFRLPGDEEADLPDQENPAIPLPLKKKLSPPLTGVRAPPTQGWRMDFVVWNNASNTFFQAVLCGFMWGMNRYNRPSWATGLFIALGCIVAGIAGIMMHIEGKKIKKIEGVPPKTVGKTRDVEAVDVNEKA